VAPTTSNVQQELATGNEIYQSLTREEVNPGATEPLWDRPQWTETLRFWGIRDTGLRPVPCNVEGCSEPRCGGASFVCREHASSAQRAYRRKAHLEALRRQKGTAA
jgi:hypothetical protein